MSLLKINSLYYLIFFGIILILFSNCKSVPEKLIDNRPNIVLIVADDMGYSDLGCFGSEILTPNLDALADQGQIFTSFYTAATCSPTRAMLLSGMDNHFAGLGNMAENIPRHPNQVGQPGYEGYLNDRIVPVSELLKRSGYDTYIAGKWHLGLKPDQSPSAKGFTRSFTLLDAYANHYYPDLRDRSFWEDEDYSEYPNGSFSTDLYTSKLIQFVEEGRKANKPFFLFAAYTAPHWPLQAPERYIRKYRSKYDIGYDSLRILRFEALKNKGVLDPQTVLPSLPDVKGHLYSISTDSLRSWASLNKQEKAIEARKMEIYAGMLENLDDNVGRLIDYLKSINEFENTLFVFLSDNGASALETNDHPPGVDTLQNMGTLNSFVAYGPSWAHASSGGFPLYKGYTAEGGIHSPMIVKMPFQSEGKGLVRAFTSVMDLAPTFLELAGGDFQKKNKAREIQPFQGASLLPYLNGTQDFVHDDEFVMGWELFGRYAVRKGHWKLTQVEEPFGKGDFELFNLKVDPLETTDVSSENMEKYKEMKLHWNEYVNENGVILRE